MAQFNPERCQQLIQVFLSVVSAQLKGGSSNSQTAMLINHTGN